MVKGVGVLLIAHGSSYADFEPLISEALSFLKGLRGVCAAEAAYLTGGRRAISEALEMLLERGASQIITVPLFMSTGKHVSFDIPKALEGVDRVLRLDPLYGDPELIRSLRASGEARRPQGTSAAKSKRRAIG